MHVLKTPPVQIYNTQNFLYYIFGRKLKILPVGKSSVFFICKQRRGIQAVKKLPEFGTQAQSRNSTFNSAIQDPLISAIAMKINHA